MLLYNIVSFISGDLDLPDRINEEWVLLLPNKVFIDEELIEHINGGAEIFFEFGFNNLTVYNYSNSTNMLELEVYKMENTLAARGIYLMKTGKEFPIKEISTRNTANPYQIILTSGRYFIKVNNYSGNKQYLPLMIRLSQILVDQIYEPETEDLFNYLPKKNIIEGSQVIFRGPLGLRSIYTFGKGDILLLGGKIFGVSADYTSESSKSMSQMVIPYPDNEKANQAFNNLILNLDPFLKVIENFDTGFVFKDSHQEYGSVLVDNSLIKIQIHLSSKP
jgi:hypothetical protein